MSLRAQYEAFLASPSTGALAPNASLHYITTLTTLNEPTAIIKHYAAQGKLLKKSDKVISAIESPDGLCVDTDTTVEFVSGGGALLPGLDDNFLADRTVTFPMVHIVQFQDQKISQIRLYWDQGSLLKQVDVIGSRARNWPIRDGKDQARLIATSSSGFGQSASTAPSRRSTASRGSDEAGASRPTSSRSGVSNAMGDPHATLELFAPRDMNQDSSTYSEPIAPRAQSAKPPPREYSELFAGQEQGSPSPANGSSDQKQRIPTKSGGGKNFKPNRLFEETEEEKAAPTPMSVKTNAKKYDHFEFGGDDDDQATPKVRESRPTTKSKHLSQWDFDDFETPEKIKPKILGQAVRHFGWSDDEDETSPVRRVVVHKPRPDAAPHFEFRDDGTPEAERKQKQAPTKGRAVNKGMGLYQDHVLHTTSDDEGDASGKQPLGDVTTTVKNENRQKDFGSHWEMVDRSPNPQKTTFNGSENKNTKHVPDDRKKVLESLDAHWSLYEQSPEQKKENVSSGRGIKTSGNGMGGRKGTGRSWAIGDEGDELPGSVSQPKGNSRAQETKSFWDF